jgi:hypothetical protein
MVVYSRGVRKMRFAKIVFLVAGVYGLIVVFPMYFLEHKTGQDFPPPISHPEYYYGFVGLCIAWQLLFLVLSRNPSRYRSMMIPSIIEKAAWFIPVVILFLQQRVSGFILGTAVIDACFGVLFIIAYVMTPAEKPLS